MCRECDAAKARERAADTLLAKCRAVSPLAESLRATFPLERAPIGMTALAAKIDRMVGLAEGRK